MVRVSCIQPDSFTKAGLTPEFSFRSLPTTKLISPSRANHTRSAILKQAQALGDFRALAKRGRRVIGVDLGDNTLLGLNHLAEILKPQMKRIDTDQTDLRSIRVYRWLKSYNSHRTRTVVIRPLETPANHSLNFQRHPPVDKRSFVQAYELPFGSALTRFHGPCQFGGGTVAVKFIEKFFRTNSLSIWVLSTPSSINQTEASC